LNGLTVVLSGARWTNCKQQSKYRNR
jgi:hypothetical protein